MITKEEHLKLLEEYHIDVKQHIQRLEEFNKLQIQYNNIIRCISHYFHLSNPDMRLSLLLKEHGVINNE